MASLTELAEFVEQVLRLDTDMPVKGFDGFTIGTANEQAQVLANRTRWLKSHLGEIDALVKELAARNVVVSVNKKSGAITLNYKDVGAAAESHKHTADDVTPTTDKLFVTPTEKRTWGNKQDKLVSGTDIKTLLSQSLLGAGNIDIAAKEITTDDDFQFLSSTERKRWDGKQNTLVSGKDISTLHGHNLLGAGNLTLTAVEVGADPSGSAEEAVDTHEQKADPHPQYVNQERGDTRYVGQSVANQPNGYLKLDEKGQIPANIAKLFEVRYLIVGTAEERLAIKGSNNVTICLQTDKNRIYYLDAGGDPSVEDNWHSGRDADPSAVISVFGRSGVISAAQGDYKTDQITETTTRVFVTPEQKTAWTGKQDKLVSGKSIRTINNTSLLGSTDIEISVDTLGAAKRAHSHNVEDIQTSDEKQFVSENDKTYWNAKQATLVSGKNIKTLNGEDLLGDGNITVSPSTIGAANVDHTHTPDEIKTTDAAQFVSADEKATWEAKQPALVSGESLSTVFGQNLLDGNNVTLSDVENLAETIGTLLQAGSGIKIEYNTTLDKVVITNTSQGGSTGSAVTVIEEGSAKNGVDYTYVIGNKMSFDFLAYALRENVISEEKTNVYTYNDTLVSTLPKTDLPAFDSKGEALTQATEQLSIATKTSNEWGSYYGSNSIDASELGGIAFSSLITESKRIIPTFSGGNSDSDASKGINGINPLSSTPFTRSQAWKALQSPVSSINSLKSLPAEDYWSDAQLWQSVKNEVYLGISSNTSEPITGYAFQTVGKFASTTSTMITDWALQGRDNNNDRWMTIDRRTKQSLVGSGEWKYYALAETVSYKKYRILVEGVAKTSGARASIARFQLLSDPYLLIQGNNSKWYTLTKNNVFEEVENVRPYTFKENGFQGTKGRVGVDVLKTISPFKVFTAEPTNIQVDRYGASAQIVLHTALEKTDLWYTLNTLSTTVKNSGDEDRLFAMVTIDGKNWYAFKNNTWTSFGTLAADTASAEQVINHGNSLRELTMITKSQWAVLLNAITNNAVLGIAYATWVSTTADTRLPLRVNAYFDKLSHWIKTNTTEVGIVLTNREIIFTPTADGSYRFCYKFN